MLQNQIEVKYFHNLDYLRFFLSLIVVIYHIPPITFTVLSIQLFDELAIFHRGSEAVFFFFTLSGFLITRFLIQEKNTEIDINLKMFYMRRVLRIWPVYFLVLCIGLTFYHYILPAVGIESKSNYSIISAIILCFFFLSNVFQTMFHPGSILSILWSIGIEEQFYLFWPVLFKKITLKNILIVLFFLYFIITLNNVIDPESTLLKYRFLFDFMIIGGIFSILEALHPAKILTFYKNIIVRVLFSGLFIIIFFTSFLNFILYYNVQLYHNICGLIAVVFIGVVVNLKPVLIFSPLAYLGKISYGIYMYHMIIVHLVLFVALKLNFADKFSPTTLFFILYSIIISLTLLFSHISFKYFEKFFLKLKGRFTVIKPERIN